MKSYTLYLITWTGLSESIVINASGNIGYGGMIVFLVMFPKIKLNGINVRFCDVRLVRIPSAGTR
jgi:hypothetical protein